MKILIIAGGLNTGGLENQITQLAVRLQRMGHEVDLTCDTREADYKNYLQANSCSVLYLPSTREVGILAFCRNLAKLLIQKKYDVIHSNELFHSGIVMFIASLYGVRKRIAHSHSTCDDARGNKLVRKVYHTLMRFLLVKFTTDYIACSTMAGEYLFGKKAIHSSKWHLAFNAIDANRFLNVTPLPLGKKDGWRYVVHVGRFVEVKNHQFILKIAQKIKEINQKICFVFVGNGNLFEQVSNSVHENALNDYIWLLDNREDVPNILHWADAFILPSLFEGMPLSLIEAQAAGLPSVASNAITPEVDFGIGLVHWISLNDTIEKWINEIIKASTERHPSNETILNVMRSKGFELDGYAKRIEAIYES